MEQNSKRPSIVGKRYQSKYTCFEKFIRSLHTKETRDTYIKHLKFFIGFCGFEKYEDLMEISDDDKYNSISDYIIYLKDDKKTSKGYIQNNLASIKKFFSVNNVSLQWDQISEFISKRGNGKEIEDRVYTRDEIIQMLDHADLRMKVVILTLLSSGMRVGGLAELKVKDLDYIEKYGIFKITVYSYDKDEKYITFCTPECADTIKKYLKYRESIGDNIKPESPILHRKITRINGVTKKDVITTDIFDEHITSNSLQQAMTGLQRKSRIISIQKESDHSKAARIRKPMMRCHAFRKIFNSTCIENNVNHYVKERLLGHRASLGLDMNYMRDNLFKNKIQQQDGLLLSEYLKVIDDLTVNEENRLKKENRILRTEKKELEIENESFTSQANRILLELRKKGIDLDID